MMSEEVRFVWVIVSRGEWSAALHKAGSHSTHYFGMPLLFCYVMRIVYFMIVERKI